MSTLTLVVFLFGPAARAKCRFQAEPFRRGLAPIIAAVGLATLHTATDRLQFRRALRLIDVLYPRSRSRKGPIAEQLPRFRRAVQAPPETGETPIFRPANQILPQRVALHVPHHLVKVFVALDRKRFVAALVEVAAADPAPVDLPVARRGDRQFPHEIGSA